MKGPLTKIILVSLILILIFLSFPFKKTKADEVVFWTLQMNDFAPYMNRVISEFEAQNPDIKIKWVDVPFSEGEKRTLASVLSDNPPDLINLNPDFSALLAQKGALWEIEEQYTNQYNKSIINSLKYNGKLYSLPWYATSAITIYNRKLTEKAGVKLPKTYNDISKIAPVIKSKTDAYVMLPNITENDTMQRILNKYGVARDYNSEKSIEVFEMFKTLYQKDLIPKETVTQTHREALEKYMAEKIVFFQAGANFLTMIKENAPSVYENTDVAPQLTGVLTSPHPSPASGEGAVVGKPQVSRTNAGEVKLGQYDFSLMNFVVPLRAKHKSEALKFALFLTNEENQLELARLTNILAVNEKTLKSDFYTKYDNSDLRAKARVISAKQLNNIEPSMKQIRNQKELNILINTAVQQILLNKSSTQKILDDLDKKYREL